MDNTTALIPANQSLGLIIGRSADPTAALEKAGKWFAKSGLFGCDREDQGMILALTCMSEGISPIEFCRTYDICEGKIRKKAMAGLAQFRQKGGKVKWIATGDDGQKAEADFTFEGQTIRVAYTIEQARLAGHVKPRSNWEKSPGNMLRARVTSNALGMLCPEIYAGEYEDTDRPAGEIPTIKLTAETPPPAAATKPEPAPAPQPPTIDVAATPVPPAPAPATAPAAPQDPGTTLPVELQEKLVAAIGSERLAAATEFCKGAGWLKVDETLENLSTKNANAILARIDRFLAKIGGAK